MFGLIYLCIAFLFATLAGFTSAVMLMYSIATYLILSVAFSAYFTTEGKPLKLWWLLSANADLILGWILLFYIRQLSIPSPALYIAVWGCFVSAIVSLQAGRNRQGWAYHWMDQYSWSFITIICVGVILHVWYSKGLT